MTFASRITRLPRAFDPDRGAEALAHVSASGEVAQLIEGTAGCSPYLAGLIAKEGDWLSGALEDPEAAFAAECARVADGEGDLGVELRRAKRRIALLIALADLGGVWPLEQVTGRLTEFADLAVGLAIRAGLAPELKRGKIPGLSEDDLDTAGGWVALAMGKMGAGELNYSSDIDLICLFDESRFDPDDYHEARAGFVKATRRMSATLNDLTGEGYVFRTDLRLRPDPAVTPVCVAMEAAERYYESLGRTWERAAYIKARPSAGDLAAGARFLETLRPFVWRRHLDFAAIQDAHDMRLRIREHKGLGGEIQLPGHDMKLGRGGIREIEFFTQTRQLIAGGRDADLRVRGTVEGLKVLAEKGWIPQDVAETLSAHYRAHREVEHRVQMVGDAQTHRLPGKDEGLDRIAAMMGLERAEFERDLKARLEEVHALTEGFFAPDGSGGKAGDAPQDDSDDLPDLDEAVIDRWRSYPALRSSRAVEIFERLKPGILRGLQESAHPGEALLAFDGFLKGLPAGVQLFSLFEANPQLVDLLVDIVGTAPALARHLARNAQVFDAVIGGDFFSEWHGAKALEAELAEWLAAEDDYERKLDLARRWAKEWRFRVGVHHLRGLIDAEEAGKQYADVADAVLGGLYPHVLAQFEAKHGAAPGRGACVLGMGSMGARRLNAVSDLDLIVIYDPGEAEMSEGKRPLAVRPYYARLTQALITALSAPMAEGRLYEVDMRLRPSGNQGPVATSWASFRAYQEDEAWVWEHLALTRARVVTGAVELGGDIEAFRRDLLARKGADRGKILTELAEMRARIAAAKAPAGPYEAKIGPGRLQDVELVAQAGALMVGAAGRTVSAGLSAAVKAGWLEAGERDVLSRAYGLCWGVQAVSKLLSEKPLAPEDAGRGGAGMLARETGLDGFAALAEALDARCGAAAEVIEAALERTV
ncbi:bifunctional [glutamine synthetase] adenylyltransferase/[glutamine synthetase]-adenylyl-L-tyrosine phosphorylase [Rhodalgimonas zhirmunskyi]|uniref:Bifunctional [glutamine synthetase] adenylyltransferase/[glutamine synthetase]-adenylyl-L-tyrosine phosphorylase n=1 Tax=Rhodalgimonas zhirmunskyi TaxID=2964767 RepID=A0AAJ1X3E2_9RHOB|nr:bifunctional [glutamine synthetase] adenylyltransferase/[glutamine synthetase]-adenylyl-L-tyrosine phosphorylase [Rhodoalgimonas zhirmunskyi]MDQ2093203.1 bifunctional [glutamine synthetase] adenylyltransferase/[glutamine synthetase]-adenylyl-L-tyrosine phosphorylase [Rhodoalgimonas zhirmunskyi]